MIFLTQRERNLRKSLESYGCVFEEPTYELPPIPVCELIVFSGKVHLGHYEKDTVLAYRLGGKFHIPNVDTLDEQILNFMVQTFE